MRRRFRFLLELTPGATWWVAPGLVLIVVVFLAPVGVLLARSFTDPPGGLTHYETFFESAGLVKILVRTVWTAAIVTAISLVVAYPVAHIAATTTPGLQTLIIGVVGASLFISLVVRCYAWLAILDRRGLVNATLGAVGLDGVEIVGVHNFSGVLIGVLQFTLPFMILPLYQVMRMYDQRLTLAAASLGAAPWRALLRVYIPLTLPGAIAGCAIVFITTLGYYIAPSILGGPQNVMIGELIAVKIRTTVEWGLGAAIASVLLVVALTLFVVFYRTTARVQEIRHA